MLIENIDNVPGLGDDEKASMVAQAKCILASRYFDVFRHYGGIPLIKGTFSGTDTSYEMPRNSIDLSASKKFGNLEIKAAIRDLLAERYYYKQFEDVVVNGQARTIEEITRSYKPGRSYNLTICYSF